MKLRKILSIVIVVLLLASLGFNLYFTITYKALDPMLGYMQSSRQISAAYSGILKNHEQFREGDNKTLQYDFDQDAYSVLLEKYPIQEIAGDGSEYEKAFRLMNEYANRLSHQSNFDNSVEMTALSLLEYGLDQPKHGMNCRCKAQILNEMLLSLGIYARKVWIMPDSEYDNECHVVNEVWDTTLNKWVMLDITSNLYWVDETLTPLSVLEIRHLLANQQFCTPIYYGQKSSDLEKTLNRNYGMFLYYLKNMAYMTYCDTMTVGESKWYYTLLPQNKPIEDHMILISEDAIVTPPMN